MIPCQIADPKAEKEQGVFILLFDVWYYNLW